MGAVSGLAPNAGSTLAGSTAGAAAAGPAGMVLGGALGSNGMPKPQGTGGAMLGGLFGQNGGVSGTGFSAPQQANIQQAVTPDQLAQSNLGAQQGLDSQQKLLAALQEQGATRNQSEVFNQGQGLANQMAGSNGVGNQAGAMSQQQALNSQLAANNGAGNLGQVYGQGQQLQGQLAGANAVQNQSQALASQQQLAQQQQATAGQYQNIANGTGPNPAQAMLNNATGANVAQQASLMAGQRGAGANVGMMARQAAQQGAGIQQNAVGQGAQMQANQQIAGLQGLSQQQQAIGSTNQNVAGIAGQQLAAQQAQQQALAGQAAQQVGLQQAGTNAQGALAGQQVAQQQAQQQALAAQSAGMVGQQAAATTALSQGQQAQQGAMLGALGAQNQANVSSQGSVNAGNAGLAQTTMKGQQDMIGGIMAGGAKAMGAAAAEGGEVVKFAAGGMPPVATAAVEPGPASSFGKFLSGWGGQSQPIAESSSGAYGSPGSGSDKLNQGASDFSQSMGNLAKDKPEASGGVNTNSDIAAAPAATGTPGMRPTAFRSGGMVPAMVSEKEIIVPPRIAQSKDAPRQSANFVGRELASGGGVKAEKPEQKAVKSGNSYDNDKIPKKIPAGSIVIPRSVIQSKDPVRGAADFVSKVMAKRGRMK